MKSISKIVSKEGKVLFWSMYGHTLRKGESWEVDLVYDFLEELVRLLKRKYNDNKSQKNREKE